MPFATIAPAIASLLSSVPDIGQVHIGDKHMRDETRARALLTSPVDGERDRVRAWVIERQAVAESWWCADRTKARERYTLRGFQAVVARTGSETSWQSHVDDVWSALRAETTIGDAIGWGGQVTGQFAFGNVAGINGHSTEIAIETEEHYTIDGVAVPIVDATRADERAGYADVAHEIASMLSAIDGIGQVHAERPWVFDEADIKDGFMVATDDGRDVMRSWRVYRLSDSEVRGYGNTAKTRSRWKLSPAYSWHDAGESYARFQDALDTVRGVVRGRGNIGRPVNSTLALSSPLQIGEVGARTIGGILCHWADASIETEESVYA